MIRITVRFPLGVYHARSATSSTDEAEWPPSPLRLLGALLAAAHGGRTDELTDDRALLQRICDAAPPIVIAPDCVQVGEQTEAGEAARLRGATRWAPRNYVTGPISPRDLGRSRAPVSKAGVAVGDRPVGFIWSDLSLDTAELSRLQRLAAEVTYVGTSRSPALVQVDVPADDSHEETAWIPASVDAAVRTATVSVRVPDALTIATFDRREDARRSATDRIQGAGMVPGIAIGREMPYLYEPSSGAIQGELDPHWWGDVIVLAIDQARSQLVPKAAAAYLVARAFRVALLGAYGKPGTEKEAPPILRARGAEPHCAIVPLPAVWGRGNDGRILGIALVLPHELRMPDVAQQRARVEAGLSALVSDDAGQPQRDLRIPGAGRLWLTELDRTTVRQTTLRPESYCAPAQRWVSVTPIVHSHWRKRGADALLRQAAADCAHVGLPEPDVVEIIRGPGRRGGASQITDARHLPEAWRSLVDGPADHLRVTFPRLVRGPVLLGRARHFGLGLCVPDDHSTGTGDFR